MKIEKKAEAAAIKNLQSVQKTTETEVEASTVNIELNSSSTSQQAEYLGDNTGMMELTAQIADAAESLSKRKVFALSAQAMSAFSKASGIMSAVTLKIQSYSAKYEAILNNPYLSDSEKQSRLKELESKISACQQEGEAKIKALVDVVYTLEALVPVFRQCEKAGISTNEISAMLKQMLANVSTRPSEFSEVKDSESLDEAMKNSLSGLLGENSQTKMKEYISHLEQKISKNESELKNPSITKEEENRLKLENAVYKTTKSLFESFVSKMS